MTREEERYEEKEGERERDERERERRERGEREDPQPITGPNLVQGEHLYKVHLHVACLQA